ncbi:MAG: hypothetical protein KDD64_00600 [Bdellovibrionales bacterium]|nr:hypothetical protein [Bdellovibrionales bacterium]
MKRKSTENRVNKIACLIQRIVEELGEGIEVCSVEILGTSVQGSQLRELLENEGRRIQAQLALLALLRETESKEANLQADLILSDLHRTVSIGSQVARTLHAALLKKRSVDQCSNEFRSECLRVTTQEGWEAQVNEAVSIVKSEIGKDRDRRQRFLVALSAALPRATAHSVRNAVLRLDTAKGRLAA